MRIETSFASQLYQAARKLAPESQEAGAADHPGGTGEGQGASFAEALAALSSDFAATLRRGEQAARDGLAGKADVQAVVEALTASELAFETAVAVRDRVVEAYQEILRMPV